MSASGDLEKRLNERLEGRMAEVNARFIRQNPRYAEIADSTQFTCIGEPPNGLAINAFACLAPKGGPCSYLICVMTGLLYYARLVSYAAATNAPNEGWMLVNTMRHLCGVNYGEDDFRHGRMTYQVATSAAVNCGFAKAVLDESTTRRARSYFSGLILSVLAHEMGHNALGHTQRKGLDTNTISRNQEREADSFAASVISDTPFCEYLLTGQILFELSFCYLELAVGLTPDKATTHPASIERLFNSIRSNREIAQSIGLTEESLQSIIGQKAIG